jgi:chromosome segregation protein
MRLKSIELVGFKSFARKTELQFSTAITSIVGPNGSGKSNVAESFRFVLGEQSMKSMRGRRGEDMIWNGSPTSPRASRASVRLVFDNSDRALNLDFDEVSIERVVYRDGGNEYLLNGSQVRLRDIAELLSQANIGASGHHIISQGEADRVLSASPKERREMVEDALGLTAYLYKREEAKRKLEKTAENMREVEGLRRELAPHLKFLQSQVKKIEESQKLRDDLGQKYIEYLKRESVYLRIHSGLLSAEREAPERELIGLGERISELRSALEVKHDSRTDELMRLEADARRSSSARDAAGREIGRIEGELAAQARIPQVLEEALPAAPVREFAGRVEEELESVLAGNESEVKNRVQALLVFAKEFIRRLPVRQPHGAHAQPPEGHSKVELESRKRSLEGELERLAREEQEIRDQVTQLRRSLDSEKDASREAERELFAAMARRSELESALASIRTREEMLARESELYKAELGEAAAIVGRAVLAYDIAQLYLPSGETVSDADIADEPRHFQEDRRKKIERLKIRLEEAGLSNSADVLREHSEALERDAFLGREVADLESSAAALNQLIEELTKTLGLRFSDGIAKVNDQFDSFFKLMFGGGNASIAMVKGTSRVAATDALDDEDSAEEEPTQEGLELVVSLPHKRVKGLHMLSGGERALTSIALIFAMSQVNPPPFLILDETDAALDEANSRRYGDMISTLGQKSQLILITHNRETMSRAGVLYGITMGSDGVSKLLSVRFEEALSVAK